MKLLAILRPMSTCKYDNYINIFIFKGTKFHKNPLQKRGMPAGPAAKRPGMPLLVVSIIYVPVYISVKETNGDHIYIHTDFKHIPKHTHTHIYVY